MTVAAYAHQLRYLNAKRDATGLLPHNVTDEQVAEVENYLENYFSPGQSVSATFVVRDGWGGGPASLKTITGTVVKTDWIHRDEPDVTIEQENGWSGRYPITWVSAL